MFSICSLCDARCCKDYVITVTPFDVLLIAEQLGKQPSEFSELSKASLLNADPSTVLECSEHGSQCSFVLSLKGQPCVFLSENRCSIHSIAPLVCRLYPYNVAGKFMPYVRCPLQAKALYCISKPEAATVEQFQSNLFAYKKLVTEWNVEHRGGTSGQCMEFLLSETKNIIAKH